MSTLEALIQEAQEVPEPVLDEVLDFLRFLKARRLGECPETALASEAVLAEDWERPEEDAAWQHL